MPDVRFQRTGSSASTESRSMSTSSSQAGITGARNREGTSYVVPTVDNGDAFISGRVGPGWHDGGAEAPRQHHIMETSHGIPGRRPTNDERLKGKEAANPQRPGRRRHQEDTSSVPSALNSQPLVKVNGRYIPLPTDQQPQQRPASAYASMPRPLPSYPTQTANYPNTADLPPHATRPNSIPPYRRGYVPNSPDTANPPPQQQQPSATYPIQNQSSDNPSLFAHYTDPFDDYNSYGYSGMDQQQQPGYTFNSYPAPPGMYQRPYGQPYQQPFYQPFQQPLSQSFFHAPPNVPSTEAPSSPRSTAPDLEKIRLEAEFRAFKNYEERIGAEQEQKKAEAQFRKEIEEELQQRAEALKLEQEEAKLEMEKFKVEAEKAAREKLQAERRSQAERERIAVEKAKRLEEDIRARIQMERRAEEEAAEARARQNEKLEGLVTEKLLQSIEQLMNIAQEKAMRNMRVEQETIHKTLENTILQDTRTNTGQTPDVVFQGQAAWRESSEAEPESEWTHSTTGTQPEDVSSVSRQRTMARDGAAKAQVQLPGGKMKNKSPSQRPDGVFTDSYTTSSAAGSDGETPWQPVPPPAPDVPRAYCESEAETTRSGGSGGSHTSGKPTGDRRSYRSYDRNSMAGERYPYSDYPPPPFEEVAEQIVEAVISRLTGQPYWDMPTQEPSCHQGSSSRVRTVNSFSSGFKSVHSRTTTVRSHSHESTRTLETSISDRWASGTTPATEAEPYLLDGCPTEGADGSSNAEAHAHAAVAVSPEFEETHPKPVSYESKTRANSESLINDLTEEHDTTFSTPSPKSGQRNSFWRQGVVWCCLCGRLAIWCGCSADQADAKK
ncbi:hypothetical protein QQS21_002827 [Conoideocrella luteorostrata]|uniref:Uncharacterized protein n=1 Tax=Conoideocrella luteorostrata TaxID=1105319 RepID=A0AAJ0G2N9_9HYPO|nr:hypothetical protein QQS21_002827 [Conoideocrella luteorostrata]